VLQERGLRIKINVSKRIAGKVLFVMQVVLFLYVLTSNMKRGNDSYLPTLHQAKMLEHHSIKYDEAEHRFQGSKLLQQFCEGVNG